VYFPIIKKRKKKVAWHWVFVFFLPFFLIFVLFAKGGVVHGYALKLQLQSTDDAADQLEQENGELRQIIHKIRTDPDVARSELAKSSLVAPQGSVIYRFWDVGENVALPVANFANSTGVLGDMIGELQNWWEY